MAFYSGLAIQIYAIRNVQMYAPVSLIILPLLRTTASGVSEKFEMVPRPRLFELTGAVRGPTPQSNL